MTVYLMHRKKDDETVAETDEMRSLVQYGWHKEKIKLEQQTAYRNWFLWDLDKYNSENEITQKSHSFPNFIFPPPQKKKIFSK